MVAFVDRDLDTQVPPAVMRASGEILFALGTVPASFDYRRGLLDVMRAELLGFYEPHEKTMFLGADLHGQELDATLWHELVHALQDQHYGLEKLLTFGDDASDWQSAVHALAEGDATSAMIDAMFSPKGARAPDSSRLRDGLAKRAVQWRRGTSAFDHQAVRGGAVRGWALVRQFAAEAWWLGCRGRRVRRLPASTEQLLHLDKYDSNEGSVVLPALAAPRLRATYSDIYGEETLRVLFEEWMPARAAHEAAAGWGGDRITAFSDDALTAVAWTVRYDSDAAAARGLRAFARGALAAEDQVLDERGRLSEFVSAAEAEQATQAGQVCRERHTVAHFAVVRRGRVFWRSRSDPFDETPRPPCPKGTARAR